MNGSIAPERFLSLLVHQNANTGRPLFRSCSLRNFHRSRTRALLLQREWSKRSPKTQQQKKHCIFQESREKRSRAILSLILHSFRGPPGRGKRTKSALVLYSRSFLNKIIAKPTPQNFLSLLDALGTLWGRSGEVLGGLGAIFGRHMEQSNFRSFF